MIVFFIALFSTIVLVVHTLKMLYRPAGEMCLTAAGRLALALVVTGLWTYIYSSTEEEQVSPIVINHIETKKDIEPNWDSLSIDTAMKVALDFYEVEQPKIVYAQARLETGNFKSRVFKDYNNAFGLYDSRNNCYYKFNHWTESVIAYKQLIQSKYKGGDYLEFLEKAPYASDKKYIKKLKELL